MRQLLTVELDGIHEVNGVRDEGLLHLSRGCDLSYSSVGFQCVFVIEKSMCVVCQALQNVYIHMYVCLQPDLGPGRF